MRRITHRGWHQSDILKLEPETGIAQVRLRNSAMVDVEHRHQVRLPLNSARARVQIGSGGAVISCCSRGH
jgi:hypothetical protein